MADNTKIDAGTTGDNIATDDINGVKYQRIKMTLGADGTNDGDVSADNPMPVSGTVIVEYDSNFIQSDEDATYKYYGFASPEGWRIKRKTLASGVWMVASGTGDYDTAWADRENKDYGYT